VDAEAASEKEKRTQADDLGGLTVDIEATFGKEKGGGVNKKSKTMDLWE